METTKNPVNPKKVELKTVRVFVSSTFRDMHAERDHINKVVFPELRSRCGKRGLEFIGIDLRWGVTEEESRQRKAMEVCLDEIKKCNFFISLLGDRYGWIPVPENISQEKFEALRSIKDLKSDVVDLLDEWYQLDETLEVPVYSLRDEIVPDTIAEKLVQFWEEVGLKHAGESITAREIYLAQVEKSDKKIFFYLRKSGLHKNPHFPQEMIPIFIDQHSNKLNKLALLKKHIQDKKNEKIKVNEYNADYEGLRIDPSDRPSNLSDKEKEAFNDNVIQPDEWSSLGDKVREIIRSKGTVALTGMEELGTLILNDLWDGIEKELEQVVEPLDAHSQERAYHDRFIAERTRLFFGRRELLENMLGYLSNIDERRPLVVTGLPGCGKSALMAQYARQCRENFPDCLVVPHFIGAAPGSTDLLSTIRSLCETLSRECNLEEEVSADSDILRGQLNSFLEKAGSVHSIIIILDAVNQLDPAYRSHELTWIPFTLPPNVRLIISTLAGDCLERLQKRVPQENILQVPVLPEMDRMSLIKEHLARRGKKLSDNQITCLLDTKKRQEAGLPLYLLVALEELCLFGNYEELNRQIEALPATLHELFDKVIERLESEHIVNRTEFILRLMAVSRYGLLESEILDLLKKYDVKIPRIYWTRFYRSLEFYLRPVDETTGSGLINFYHDQLRFAVYRRYLHMNSPDAAKTEKYRHSHEELADYFRSIASDRNESAKWSTENPRGLIELPYHLHESGRDEELRNMLFDYAWMHVKLEATDVNSLLIDYDYLPPEKKLRLVQETIRLSAHILDRNKKQIRSQLYGRLMGQDTPEIKTLLDKIMQWKDGTWLHILSPSLNSPGHLIRTLEGHKSPVLAVSVLPDGKQVISGSWENLKVWDLESGEILHTYKVHTSYVTAVSVLPDGKRAISGSDDKTLKVWDIESGKILHTLEGHTHRITAVSVLPDGKRAISSSKDRTLKVWDMENGKVMQTLEGHTDSVWAVSVLPDGKRAISGSWDNTLKVWDMESGKVLHTLKGHTDQVRAVSVLPDGKRAISGSDDRTLKVWDMENEEVLHTLKGHTGYVTAVSVLPDGNRAISGSSSAPDASVLPGRGVIISSDNTLKVWDMESGEALNTFKDHTDSVWAVSVLPDGKHAISGSEDRTLKVWDMESEKAVQTLEGHTGYITALSVLPDGKRLISGSDDRTLKVWDMENGKVVHTFEGHTNGINAVSVMPDGKRAISTSWDNILKVWDLERGKIMHTLKGHTSVPVSILPGEKRAISAFEDMTLKVWDLESGEVLHTLKGHNDRVTALSVLPDGKRAISGSMDRTLKVWDLESEEVVHTLVHNDRVTAVSVLPDGKRAISTSWDNTLKVWDLESGKDLHTLNGHTDSVIAVSVLPDGKRAISGSWDKTLKVWNLKNGEMLRTLKGHADFINAVAVLPDGNRAISASEDNTLKIWDIERRTIIADFSGDSSIRKCAVSLDGKTIIAGEKSGKVHFLRLEGE